MKHHRGVAGALALTATMISTAKAQTIDAGRGPISLTVPEGYDAGVPTPLIVALHGYTLSGEILDRAWGISALANQYRFLTIAPDGEREPEGRRNRYWNASDACCNFNGTDIDDSGYIRGIIDQIKSRYNVDPGRVYVIGHSNGGFMSYRMAYEHSDAIAAIASLAGANHLEERDPPPYPVHVLQIHGTDDATIAYRGGEINENRYPSAMGSVTRWARYNGCDMSRSSRETRDLDASLPGHETGVMKINTGCKDGGSAELWTISDGAHSPVYSDTYGEQIVEWLLAHPKPPHLLD
ncbi:MAG TPA: alpha/beta fold hydrolase [Longimicrobiales bacterium]|nr:alpha/beta fold hydrolase [Longimicrobiales bacterium]